MTLTTYHKLKVIGEVVPFLNIYRPPSSTIKTVHGKHKKDWKVTF